MLDMPGGLLFFVDLHCVSLSVLTNGCCAQASGGRVLDRDRRNAESRAFGIMIGRGLPSIQRPLFFPHTLERRQWIAEVPLRRVSACLPNKTKNLGQH